MVDITEFKGEYRWLSNFWPCIILFDGHAYGSVEAAFVAAKTEDETVRQKVRELETAGQCRRFGRKMKLRDNWDDIKLGVMESLLREKFKPHGRLGRRLIATNGSQIIEGNTWGDTFWGVCDGEGDNHLGRLLMLIRADIASQAAGG